MVCDEQYWRSYIERFIKEEVRAAYDDILADRRYRLAREGQLLLVVYPFDAVLDKIKGTTKAISKTRIQAGYEATATGETERRAVDAAATVLARGDLTPWAKRAEREEHLFAARMAAMAATAARNLNNAYSKLSTSTQRLSSGLRINSSADDAAGLAVRELMAAYSNRGNG